LGSGTTLMAAQSTGRVCYGIEIDPLFVDVAIRRWQAFTGEKAHRLNDGQVFDAADQFLRTSDTDLSAVEASPL
jgi:DNA modification methylase